MVERHPDRTVAAERNGFPIASFEALWHVGTFDLADKGCNGESHEGRGLSVSVDPDAWVEIHRLGGLPVWELTRAGNAFLDFHRLDRRRRKAVAAWCVENGYAVRGKAWKAEWQDDEAERRRHMLFDTRVEAEAQVEDEPDATVGEVEVHRATALMEAFVGRHVDPVEMPDHMAAAYADKVLGLDGVWWEDERDPDLLSAPRGVIFPERLAAWRRAAASPDGPAGP